jgi:hypothetical protein
MVWIDTEGHEGYVLRGGTTLAARGVPMVFELDPTGLKERGDAGMLHEVVERTYTHFVDVRRRKAQVAPGGFGARPVSELREYASGFGDPTGAHHTDILVLRLDEAQADVAADLGDLEPRAASPESDADDPEPDG